MNGSIDGDKGVVSRPEDDGGVRIRLARDDRVAVGAQAERKRLMYRNPA